MTKIEVSRTIRAPREEVFDLTTAFEDYADVNPTIVGVEFLTEQHSGPGTRFRETRRSGRRAATDELEITEYDQPARIRLVGDRRGSRRETTFTYLNTREGTDVHLSVDVRPKSVVARVRSLFVRDPVTRDVEAELDVIEAYFESS